MDALLELGRNLKFAATRSYQQFELVEQLFHYAGASIVPSQDPFGRVAPADKIKPGVRVVMSAAFLRKYTRCRRLLNQRVDLNRGPIIKRSFDHRAKGAWRVIDIPTRVHPPVGGDNNAWFQ